MHELNVHVTVNPFFSGSTICYDDKLGPVWFEGREGEGRENEPLPLHGLKNWRGGIVKYSLPFPSFPLFWLPPNWGVLEGGQNLRPIYPHIFLYFHEIPSLQINYVTLIKINTGLSPPCLTAANINWLL